MKRFKNILFVSDQPGIESVGFDRALELAQANDAAFTVMDVVEPVGWSAEYRARYGTDLSAIIRDRRLEELADITAPYSRSDCVIRTQVAIGTPFLEVIKETIKNGFDLVINSAEPADGLLRNGLGANDHHLIRKCPCPVWIDRADRPRPYRNILAAIDPLEDPELGLARTVMDLATSFGPWEGSEVHVVHAWRLPGETSLQGGRARVPDDQLDEILMEKRAMHAEALETLLLNYGMDLEWPTVHFHKSRPEPLIAQLADSLPADLIVMGTVGRTGIPGFFIGNTAESVIRATELPVLTVKPRGFVSPVTL